MSRVLINANCGIAADDEGGIRGVPVIVATLDMTGCLFPNLFIPGPLIYGAYFVRGSRGPVPD
jgi:hypothetical protein